jgi:NAD(P)-dependent dehydrogenase (short-subunit alcohol dehydrogenase family)
MLTKVLALELAPYGIAVNAVAPGHIATPMTGSARDRALPQIPLGRPGGPEEVAEIVTLLARDGYTTGASVLVDGGLALTAVVPLQAAVE